MNIVWNILAVIVGIVAGSIVNMMLVMVGALAIPAPAGVDASNLDSIKASIHLFETKHFIFPFLAHAIGTLAGGLVAALIAASSRMVVALVVGAFFLFGGIVASILIPAPTWFVAADMLLAYIPMAFIGWKLSGKA